MRLEPLTDYLKESGCDRVKLGLAEIEAIIGEPLLPSAWNHRTFWANSERNPYARAWMDAGYRVQHAGPRDGALIRERAVGHVPPPAAPCGLVLNRTPALRQI